MSLPEGAVVVVVAFFIRRSLHETPEFEQAKAAGEIARMPLVPLLRNHWRDVVRVICCAFVAAVSTVFGNLAIAYGVEQGLNASLTLWLVVVANIVALGTQPLFGLLADRIGRKPVFIYGALSSAVFMPFYMLSMGAGNDLLTFGLAVLTFSFGYAAANAVWPSFYAEMFSTRVRFSGMAIGTQLGFLMAGFAPSIVAALGGVSEGGWVVISAFTATIAIIAAVSALTARETRDVPTDQLGLAPKREQTRAHAGHDDVGPAPPAIPRGGADIAREPGARRAPAPAVRGRRDCRRSSTRPAGTR